MSAVEAIVNPFKVEGNVEYMRLVQKFGTDLIDDQLIQRFETVTGHRAHHWIRRGIFFSHRELNQILDDYERGKPIFLYTGRGPSADSLHLGHTTSYEFTAWLQKVFKCPVVIQMSDDEKYAFKDIPFKTIYDYGRENSKDLIAFGFDENKTFIFSNRDYRHDVPEFVDFVYDLQCHTTALDNRSIFGFDDYLRSQFNVSDQLDITNIGDNEEIDLLHIFRNL